MKTYGNYLGNEELNLEADLLDLVKTDHMFQIYYGADPLTTPGGNSFSHPSEQFLRAVITDIQLRVGLELPGASFASIFAYKIDILDNSIDYFMSDFNSIITNDPFILIKTTGNPGGNSLVPDDPLFSFSYNTLSGLLIKINQYLSGIMGNFAIDESDKHPIFDLAMASYIGLDNWKKAVMHTLYKCHRSGIVMQLALVDGKITPTDYAKGLVSLKIISSGQYETVVREAAEITEILSYHTQNLNYMHNLQAVILDGEGDATEFKSTLRWDIRAGKTNPAIERACLKTIAAFLNSRGGTLLIGVRDDGSIEGIETDKFSNEDKFLLHLWTLVRTCFGKEFSPYIRTTLEKTEEKTVCLVHCVPSIRPAFLRQPGFAEEMYIRVGPSSNALDISEALTYIKERFHTI